MAENEPLDVSFISSEELGPMIRDGTHWVVVFGRGCIEYIDKLDAALGVYPTFPTITGALIMTMIPKSRISAQQMDDALDEAGGLIPLGIGKSDIFVITNTPNESESVMAKMEALIGPDA